MTSSQLSARAIKRLQRDLLEIHTNPLPTVAALPLPHDIGVWHVNLRPTDGAFAQSVFHFRLTFPADYPCSPPSVEMLSTGMPGHPNVFGEAGHVYICLSMLKPHTKSVKYDGWTSAYSCMSLLLQLQSFLFATTGIEQDYGETDWHKARAFGDSYWSPRSIKIVRANNECFSLQIGDGIIHTHHEPWPPFVDVETLSTAPVPEAILRRRAIESVQRELEDVERFIRSLEDLERRAAAACELQTCCPTDDGTGERISTTSSTSSSSSSYSSTSSCSFASTRLAVTPSSMGFSYKETAMRGLSRTKLPRLLASRATLAAKLETLWREVKEADAAAAGQPQREERLANPTAIGSLADLPADVLLAIADLVRTEDLPSFGRVCSSWRDVSLRFNLFARRQLCCFHTKERFGSPGVVLGVGLALEFHRSGELKEVSSAFDLMSEGAFSQDATRLSVWKATFTHFLPLAISASHFETTIPYLEAITKQAFGPAAKTTHLLDLLAASMNSMVVQLFLKQADDQPPPLHASEVALDGYCGFHHLLLSAAHRWPHIRAEAERRVTAFVGSERCRDKSNTADLGRLLICLTLSSKGWNDALCYPFLREMLARNVRWVLQKKPSLENPSLERAKHTFEASLTSLRLVAFQVLFLHLVGRPSGTSGPHDVLAGYERRLGRPTGKQRATLQDMAKRTLKLSSWAQFFTLVGANVPSGETLQELLVGSIASSAAKGYHRVGARARQDDRVKRRR